MEVVPGVSGDCFQLCFTRFLGGPIGGICWVAKARKASAIRCGWEFTMDLKPTVSITSVACLQKRSRRLAIASSVVFTRTAKEYNFGHWESKIIF